MKLAIEDNEKQRPVIIGILEKANKPLTAREVWNLSIRIGRHFELTSVRRELCDLANKKKTDPVIVIKLDAKKMGVRGKPEHLYCLVCNMEEVEKNVNYKP